MPAAPSSADGAKGKTAIDQRAAVLRRGLRRMRTIATLLLAFMTLIFVATTVAKVDW
jgi:hypothetical protein